MGYAKHFEATVIAIGQIGFDVASAWMRDETSIDAAMRDRVEGVGMSLRDVKEAFESDFQEFENPKGYGAISCDQG